MNKKLVIGIISTILLLMTGCTNLGTPSSTSSPMSQERIASSVDINEEIYGIGSSTIEESGQGVAKMRASKAAREDISAKISKETTDVLKAYLMEIDFYSKNISDNVIKDLSEYITNTLLGETEEKDTWVENDKVYTVITIERSKIPSYSRDIFVFHIDSIIKKLTEVKAKIIAIPIDNVDSKPQIANPLVEEVPTTTEATENVTVTEEAVTEKIIDTAPAVEEEVSETVELDDDVIDVQL